MRRCFYFCYFLLGLVGACSKPPDARGAEDARAIEGEPGREPKTEEDKQILSALPKLAPNQRSKLGQLSVSAEAPYYAASGAECRELSIERSGGERHDRLVCKDEQGWFFVPSVQGEMDEAKP